MSLPVLIVLHQEHSTPGRVGNALKIRGFTLDIRRPRFDEPLPETLENHAGAVIFGGPQSANDDDRPAIRLELGWLEQVACAPATREHESLVVVNAKPSHIHAALLMAGFEPGTPLITWASYAPPVASSTPSRR